jgi:hypothetical protein
MLEFIGLTSKAASPAPVAFYLLLSNCSHILVNKITSSDHRSPVKNKTKQEAEKQEKITIYIAEIYRKQV